nr:MAG TPA: hypothetical protein [Caudoviricetes sp.]
MDFLSGIIEFLFKVGCLALIVVLIVLAIKIIKGQE